MQAVQYKFKMPEEMRTRLKAAAVMNRRSMSQQVVLMLECALASAAATTEGSLQAHTSAVALDETALAGGPINQR